MEAFSVWWFIQWLKKAMESNYLNLTVFYLSVQSKFHYHQDCYYAAVAVLTETIIKDQWEA